MTVPSVTRFKQCRKCKRTWPAIPRFFGVNMALVGGLQTACRACLARTGSGRGRLLRQMSGAKLLPTPCQKCGAPLNIGKKFCSHACYSAARNTVDVNGMRQCKDCGEKFPASHSHKNSNWCRVCRAAYYRARAEKDAVMNRERHLRQNWNITVEEYQARLEEQGGGCGICLKPPRVGSNLHVDHCHDTGAIRGLLCFNCNVALGKFNDSAPMVRAALNYLEGSQ